MSGKASTIIRPKITVVLPKKLPKKYEEVAELTPAIVNEYIQKIVVHAPDKSSGKRRQRVQIFFNSLGEFNLPALNEPVIIENTPKDRKTA